MEPVQYLRALRQWWQVIVALTLVGFIALLAGFTTGPRGAGLRSVEQAVGLEPVRQIAPRLARVVSGAS